MPVPCAENDAIVWRNCRGSQIERGGAHLLVIEPVDAGDELPSPCSGVLDRIHHYRDAGLVRLA